MKQLIACCGLDCENCDARIATINNDDKLREETAQKMERHEQHVGDHTGNHKLHGLPC